MDRWRLAALALVVAAGGCVSHQPLVLSSRYTPPVSDALPAPARGRPVCLVRVSSIKDLRADPATLGTVVGRPVHPPPDVMQWLQHIMLGLNAPGLSVTVDKEPTGGMSLDVELITAWVTELRSAKSANIVLRVTYHHGTTDGGTGQEPKLYRGAASSIDWNATDSELQGMIDRALSRVLAQMQSDLLADCHTRGGGTSAAR